MSNRLPIEDLPDVEATTAWIQRERSATADSGPNWAAVSAAFVCPGAGQWICGQFLLGVVFFLTFMAGVLIGLIPLGQSLFQSIQNLQQGAGAAPPIPWVPLVIGMAVAVVSWICGMIHAASCNRGEADRP